MDSTEPGGTATANPKKMRAIGFEVEEMMKLFLVIIIGLGVVILIIAASGGISALLTEFCAKNPQICGETQTQKDYNMATVSFQALVKAHECVLGGCDCTPSKPCIFYADEIKKAGLGLTGFQTLNNQQSKEVTVQCENYRYSRNEPFAASSENECNQECERLKNTQTQTTYGKIIDCKSSFTPVSGLNLGPGSPGYTPSVCTLTITVDSLSCNVKNFNLPDNFKGISGDAKEYIEGFGDPNFLIYFQNFPEGEDSSWAGYSPWADTVAVGMFFGMCASSFLGPVAKKIGAPVLKRIVKYDEFMNRVRSNPELKAEAESALTYMYNSFKGTKRFNTVDQIYQQTDAYVMFETSQSGVFSRLKEALKDQMVRDLKAKGMKTRAIETAIRFGGYTGVDAEAAYVASYIDSIVGKFIDENPNSLVLGTPLKKPEPTPLSNSALFDTTGPIQKIGKPLVIDKGSLVDSDVSLVLASPCHADIKVKKELIVCNMYSYDRTNGMVKCIEPDIGKSGDICGGYSAIMNQRVEYRSNIINILENADKVLFTYQGASIKEIRIPSVLAPGMLTNIRSKSQCSAGQAYACYDFDFAYGVPEKQITLEMTCGGEQVSQSIELQSSIMKIFSKTGKLSDFSFCTATPVGGINPDYAAYKASMGAKEIIWVKDKATDKFFETIIYNSAGGSMSLFKDEDGDGKWNQFILFTNLENSYIPNADITKSLVYDDKNGDGSIDIVESARCQIDGVVTSVSASGYSDKPNFCYGKQSWTGYGLTLTSFAIDAAAKSIPSPFTWLGGAVANCALGIFQISTNPNWPNGGVGG